MEKKRIVIQNIPMRYPLLMTLIIGLYMDRFSAPEWLWGVVSVLVALLWFGVYYYRKDCDTVDLFDVSLREKVENSGLKKSKFQQRLDKLRYRSIQES